VHRLAAIALSSLAAVALLALSGACSSADDGGGPTAPPSATEPGDTAEPAATATATTALTTSAPTPTTGGPSPAEDDLVMLTGLFAIVIGDPPPGSDGEARTRATLIDEDGVEWQLLVDPDVYTPTGELVQYNVKQVRVDGQVVVGEERTILVTSLEIDE